jgi:hypothetical protein
MFDFLKPKTKMRPEELGMALATVLVSQWPERITKHSQEYGRQVSNITKKELNDLWLLFLMLHCTVISVGIESSNLGDSDTRIILDAFWNSVPDLLRENGLENESVAFQANTARWYEILREPVLEPTSAFSPGNLGPGKTLFKLAMPNRDMRESIDLITELTFYFVSTVAALSEFAINSVKKTKLLPSMISYG